MENRLVLIVLLVTLSWGFMGTYAQSNSTIAPNNTTSGPNITTVLTNNNGTAGGNSGTTAGNSGTTGGNNGTTAGNSGTTAGNSGTMGGNNGTTGGSSGTTGGNGGTLGGNNGTTVGNSGTTAGNSGTMGGNNGTTGGSSGTTGGNGGTLGGNNGTTVGNSGTTAGNSGTMGGNNGTTGGSSGTTGGNGGTLGGNNGTTGGSSGTTGGNNGTTGGNNTTASSNTTTATTATPVGTLATPISRAGCGSSKLCVADPSACDPSTGDQCFFISTKQNSGQKYDFELSGQSDGYIAAGLSTTTSLDGAQTYICAKNMTVVNFFTAKVVNQQLNVTMLNTSNVKGSINSNKIQCTFSADLPDTTRAAGYSMSVSTGTYNSNSGALGNPSLKIQTNVVNLADPNATITNLLNNTNSTSAAYPVTHQQSLMIPALLVTVTILAFTAH